MVEFVWMTSGDALTIERASALFDDDVRPEWAERFLRQPNHHLCIAYDDGDPAGFVTGVEITHPDKGTEMLLYEIGVDEAFRRRGIGSELCRALAELARERECTGLWVPVDHDNDPALAMYRALRPDEDASTEIIWWDLTSGGDPADGGGAS